MDIKAFADAKATVHAQVETEIDEDVEIGVIYEKGIGWTPYINNEESDYLVINLDVAGEANAEIRLIPKIEIKFYKAVSGSFSVEPFIESSLAFADTTEHGDFLTTHSPDDQIHLTSFDVALGLECHIEALLTIIGKDWELLPKTCVLGTDPSCTYNFNKMELFSIPEFTLMSSAENPTELSFQAIDGTHNPLNQSSVAWEVYPTGAIITPGSCSKSAQTTICSATITPGEDSDYTVFASGFGKIGDMGRQFREVEVNIGGTCASQGLFGPETVVWQDREWQRCDDGNRYSWSEASDYCQDLVLGGHSDWYLPSKDELKSLVVCSNGHPTPLEDYDYTHTSASIIAATCWTNHPPPPPYDWDIPTIDSSFQAQGALTETTYWTSTEESWNGQSSYAYWVNFSNGITEWQPKNDYPSYVRCVR